MIIIHCGVRNLIDMENEPVEVEEKEIPEIQDEQDAQAAQDEQSEQDAQDTQAAQGEQDVQAAQDEQVTLDEQAAQAAKDAQKAREIKKKKRKKRNLLLYLMMGISAAAVLTFGVLLGIELYTNWQSQNYYSNLSSGVVTRPRQPGYSKPSPTPGDDNGADEGELDVEEPDEDVFVWEPYVDFEALRETYTGIVGWIKLEGTPIDYPIMQTDNNWFYLGHLPDGTSHRSGSIFLDYRSSPDFSDKSMLIYGHYSRTQDMFGSLEQYRKQEYFETHPVIYIYTPQCDYEMVLIAGYLVDSGVGAEVPPLKFSDDDAFMRHIEKIKRLSFFQTDVEVTPDDRIIGLATCAYDYTNARWILVGILKEF